MFARFFKGLCALIVLVAVIAGIPAFLVLVVGNPLPSAAQWQQIAAFQPDYGNVILLAKILPCVAWIAWAFFALPWLYELVGRAGGRAPQRKVWLFSGQQKMAAALIAAVFLMFAGTASLASTSSADAAPAQDSHAAVAQFLQTPAAPATAVVQASVQQQVAAPQHVQHAALDYEVKPGDNLWNIAQSHLGAGQDYHEIADASEHIVQAGGQHLTDPNLIQPGWHLEIPGAGAAIVAPAPAAAPVAPATPAPTPSSTVHTADHAGGSDEGAARTGAETKSSAHSATQQSAPDEARSGDFSAPLATAGGIAGLLASGLLLALGRRRLQQRRRRQPGERIAMPERAAAGFEAELRMVENPGGQSAIDDALRGLQIWAEDTGSRLPELLAARVTGAEISLFLAWPTVLPAPFTEVTSDRTVWSLPLSKSAAPSRQTVSPYPALTTVGIDAQGGHLLLDLEQIGSLNVIGDDPQLALGVLNALAVELASSPWSDGVRVTLVGMPSTLARDIDRYRVQHVDDVEALLRNLRADLEDRRAALDSFGSADVHDARAHASDDEGWAPHVVLLASVPAPRLKDQLDELVAQTPRLGIATISRVAGENGSDASSVVVWDRQRAEYRAVRSSVPPLPFRPQLLEGRELELAQTLFETTLQASKPPVVVTPTLALPPVEASESTGVDEFEDPEATLEFTRKPRPEALRPALIKDIPGFRNAPSVRGTVPDWPAPFVRLLGPIDALSISDGDGMPGRGVELMAYLLLKGGTATSISAARVTNAMWPEQDDPKNANVRALAQQVRAVLGNAPDGRPLLPEGRNDLGLRLHPAIRCDWDDFVALTGPTLSRTPTEDLIAALALVRGEPFTGADRRRGWWGWRAMPAEEMIAEVLDAATELAARGLSVGDTAQVRLAARAAQTVDPLNEVGWRFAIKAAIQAGDAAEFDRVVDELYARLGADDLNYALDAATQRLVDDAQARFSAVR